MSEILKNKEVKIRKVQRCFGCGRRFKPSTKMLFQVVKADKSVFNIYMCKTCVEIQNNFCRYYEFGEGDLREEALEIEKARAEAQKEAEKAVELEEESK